MRELKHLVALGIKFAMTVIVVFLLWPFFGIAAPLSRILMAFWITVLLYPIGDLMFLPSLGSTASAIIDGLSSAVILFMGQLFSPAFSITFLGALLLGGLIAVAEWFFHKFVKTAILTP